jgi:hypothetical protein
MFTIVKSEFFKFLSWVENTFHFVGKWQAHWILESKQLLKNNFVQMKIKLSFGKILSHSQSKMEKNLKRLIENFCINLFLRLGPFDILSLLEK